MDRYEKKGAGVGIAVGMLTFLMVISLAHAYYPVKKDICKETINAENEVGTEAYKGCIGFLNYPVWEYYFPMYFLAAVTSSVIAIVSGIVVAVWLDPYW